ncbi:uncharacterized protein LOC131664504 [Phymastichus coffea]|uniref:uncharacterized protein LOC131664504 n=1 Tax=Phymastichus coffea TaxID=108790 RepID=UPI00273CB00A|nr:uncharacterized protein LOC131664504 [Phymastichus coffea]
MAESQEMQQEREREETAQIAKDIHRYTNGEIRVLTEMIRAEEEQHRSLLINIKEINSASIERMNDVDEKRDEQKKDVIDVRDGDEKNNDEENNDLRLTRDQNDEEKSNKKQEKVKRNEVKFDEKTLDQLPKVLANEIKKLCQNVNSGLYAHDLRLLELRLDINKVEDDMERKYREANKMNNKINQIRDRLEECEKNVRRINLEVNNFSNDYDEANLNEKETSGEKEPNFRNVASSSRRDGDLSEAIKDELDYFTSELRSKDLLYIIDEKVGTKHNNDADTREKDEFKVRDILINHLDQSYHERTIDIKDPVELLKRMEEIKRCENNTTTISVRKRMYAIRYDPSNNSVTDLWDRFENLFREYNNVQGAQPLSEDEKRDAFYTAIVTGLPEIRTADFMNQRTTGKKMSYEDLKLYLMQAEAERGGVPTRGGGAMSASVKKDYCYRCHDRGHMCETCPHKNDSRFDGPDGLRKCYCCNKFVHHKYETCPQNPRKQRRDTRRDNEGNGNYSRYSSQNNYNNRGRGHNKYNGFKRKFDDDESYDENNKKRKFDSSSNRGRGNNNFRGRGRSRGRGGRRRDGSQNNSNSQKQNEAQEGVGLIETSNERDEIIQIDNVIYAESLSENLLSLRKFTDQGLSVYLDNKIIDIYDPILNKTFISGIYQKPYWIIEFEINKNDLVENCDENRDRYKQIVAFLATDSNGGLLHMTRSVTRNLKQLKSIDSKDDENNDSELRKDKTTPENENEREQIIENVPRFSTTICDRKIEEMDVENEDENEIIEIEKDLNHIEMTNCYKDKAMLWHARLGHASLNYLKAIQNQFPEVKELKDVIFDEKILDCEICMIAKMNRLPFQMTRQRATQPLEIIHADTMGMISHASYPKGYKYISVFVDDYSRLALTFPMKAKDETGTCFEEFVRSARNLLGYDAKVCYLRTDQGTEFVGGYTKEVMDKLGTEYQLACPDTPQHNGVLERFNQTIQKKVRSYMFDAKIPENMWDLALGAATYAYNRTPHKSNDMKPPLKTFAPKYNIDFSQIKRFGCLAYSKKEIENETGKASETEGEQKRKRERPRKEKISKDVAIKEIPINDVSFTYFTTIEKTDTIDLKSTEKDKNKTMNSCTMDEAFHALLAKINKDPATYKDAMSTPDRDEWQKAIDVELNAMRNKNVWKIVPRPIKSQEGGNPNIIDSKWVFKIKSNPDLSPLFRARLAMRGFKDHNQYDLRETYAPVSKLSLVRGVLTIINKHNLNAIQLDVKTAFLNGEIKEEIYMEIPEGLRYDTRKKSNYVCKLMRALYGLKISPKRWNKKLRESLESIGLNVYVDDILAASNNIDKLTEVKEKMLKEFEMTDLGEPQKFLGIRIRRDKERKIMQLDQTEYIDNMLRKFGFENMHPTRTPMVTNQVNNLKRKLREEEIDETILLSTKSAENVPYREMVGNLLYLANASRPDISYAVNVASRHQINPTVTDYEMVKRIFRYLKGTRHYSLTYREENDMQAYADASYADCKGSLTTCGFVIKLYGDPISWRTHKQPHVTLSTCEAEYITMSDTCQELVGLDNSLKLILNKSLALMTLWCDNRAAGKNTEMDGGNKLRHVFEIKEHYVKECVEKDLVKVKWVESKKQLADIFTKSLPFQSHIDLTYKIMNLKE